jgi:hypothetical protein
MRASSERDGLTLNRMQTISVSCPKLKLLISKFEGLSEYKMWNLVYTEFHDPATTSNEMILLMLECNIIALYLPKGPVQVPVVASDLAGLHNKPLPHYEWTKKGIDSSILEFDSWYVNPMLVDIKAVRETVEVKDVEPFSLVGTVRSLTSRIGRALWYSDPTDQDKESMRYSNISISDSESDSDSEMPDLVSCSEKSDSEAEADTEMPDLVSCSEPEEVPKPDYMDEFREAIRPVIKNAIGPREQLVIIPLIICHCSLEDALAVVRPLILNTPGNKWGLLEYHVNAVMRFVKFVPPPENDDFDGDEMNMHMVPRDSDHPGYNEIHKFAMSRPPTQLS